jgi:hypothetical protein
VGDPCSTTRRLYASYATLTEAKIHAFIRRVTAPKASARGRLCPALPHQARSLHIGFRTACSRSAKRCACAITPSWARSATRIAIRPLCAQYRCGVHSPARRWVLPAREVGRRSTVSLRFQSCGCRRDTCAELVRFAPHCRLLPARRLLFARTQTSRRFNATRRNSAPIHDNRDTPASAAKAP